MFWYRPPVWPFVGVRFYDFTKATINTDTVLLVILYLWSMTERIRPFQGIALEVLSGPEILAAMEGVYFVRKPGGVVFLDLLTSEPLEPGMPVPGIEWCPIVREGLDNLRDLGSRERIGVNLVLAQHGSAQHFTDIRRQYGDRFPVAPIVAIEANWSSRDEDPMRPTLANTDITLASPGGRREFQENQIRWLTEHRKIILPCDYSVQDELNTALLQAWEVYMHASLHPELFDRETRNTIRVIANAIVQSTRRWMILGQLGYWMQDEQIQIPDQGLTVDLMLGSWHEDSVGRLANELHTKTNIHRIAHRSSREYDRYGDIFMAMTYTGRATTMQLRAMLPFEEP